MLELMRQGRGIKVAAIWSATAVAIPGGAFGQPPAAAGEIEEIMVVAQRNNQTQVSRQGSLGALGDKAAEDVPFSVKSYNAALILNQQPQTLGQVLENDPSVRTTYGYGNAAEQFVIRGFVLNGDDVAFDGLYGLTPRQLVAPELYEQVQVLNGASAFLNGAAPGGSGIGGSVNLIPKRATGRDLQRFTINHTQTGHFGASFDVGRRFGDTASGVRINGALRRGDVAIDDEFRNTQVLGGAYDYDGDGFRFSADLAYQRVEVESLRPKVQIGTQTIPRVPTADHNYAQSWTYSTLRDVFGMVRLEYDLRDDALVYASLGARDGSEKGVYDGITIVDVDTGAATGSGLYVPRTDNNQTAQAGVRVRLGSAVSHELNFGASTIRQVNRNAYDFLGGFVPFDTNLYDTPDVPLPGTGFTGGNLDDPFAINRKRLNSVFASDTIGFRDDRVLLTAGLRLQQIDDRSYSYVDGTLSSRYDEDAVTPVLGVVVKSTNGFSFFVNRIEGLAQGPTAPIDPTVVNSGEVFGPAESTQYELGGKIDVGRFNASFALYQTDQPSAYSVPEPGNPGFVRYGVFGKQRNRGLELGLDGEVAAGLRLIAGASLNDAKLRRTQDGLNDGHDAPGVPAYLINANVEWDVPSSAITLTGRVVRTGEQKVNTANTLEIPAWTRVDLGLRYVALVGERPLTLRFGIDNVADERYWASAFDSFVAQLLQGGPRTFKLSASIDL